MRPAPIVVAGSLARRRRRRRNHPPGENVELARVVSVRPQCGGVSRAELRAGRKVNGTVKSSAKENGRLTQLVAEPTWFLRSSIHSKEQEGLALAHDRIARHGDRAGR